MNRTIAVAALALIAVTAVPASAQDMGALVKKYGGRPAECLSLEAAAPAGLVREKAVVKGKERIVTALLPGAKLAALTPTVRGGLWRVLCDETQADVVYFDETPAGVRAVFVAADDEDLMPRKVMRSLMLESVETSRIDGMVRCIDAPLADMGARAIAKFPRVSSMEFLFVHEARLCSALPRW